MMRFLPLPLLVLAATAMPCVARSDPPDYSRSTIQGAWLDVEGSTNGIPDNCADGRCGSYLVTIRDFANVPVAGSSVVVDFGNCPDVLVSCEQLTSVTGQTLAGPKQVGGTTNASGQFTFHVQGAANAIPMDGNVTSPGTNAGVPCAQITADGVPLATVAVSAYDLNGLGSPTAAVGGADVSLLSGEVLKGALGAQPRARGDYNHTATVSGADVAILSRMAAQASLGTGSQRTGPFCP